MPSVTDDEKDFTNEQIDDICEQAQDNFTDFAPLVSGNKNPAHLALIAKKIQKAIESPASNKNKLLIISVPPRHGKTQLISVHLPAWYLGNYPKNRIILSSYGAELAETNSDAARAIFSEWGPILWGVSPSKTKFSRSSWDTDQGGGVRAAGVGGPTTGFGADCFVIDDYVKDHEEAESETQREKIWNWWQAVASTRLHPGAVVIIFATRWHSSDLIGRLLKQRQEEGDEFPFETEGINLPALAEKNDLLGRSPGEALWPWRFNETRLQNIKKTVGPYWWSALYQGSPTARGGTLFRSAHFRYYVFDAATATYLCYRQNEKEPVKIRKHELTRHVYVDPAIEIKTSNDPTGMQAWGYSRKYRVWLLLDRVNDRIEHTQVLGTIKNFAFKNMCTLVGIENEKLGKVLVKQSAGNDQVGDFKIPFKEIPTKGMDKYARAVPMATYIENERVFFPRNISWLANFEDNLVKFPKAEHDEDVDCLAMAQFMEAKFSVTDALSGR